jgi:hypothetical protein
MNMAPTLHIHDIDDESPITYVTCYRDDCSIVTFGIVSQNGNNLLLISENGETRYEPIKYYYRMFERNMHVLDALHTSSKIQS